MRSDRGHAGQRPVHEPGTGAGAATRQAVPGPGLPPCQARNALAVSLPGRARALAAKHWARFGVFSIIGAFTVVLNLPLQALFVQAWHAYPVVAYVAAGFLTIQVSFLLNRWLTWRDRPVSFWGACCRFNVQRFISGCLMALFYAGLVWLGIQYLIANLMTTAVFTLVNYMAGHLWAFAVKARASRPSQPLTGQSSRSTDLSRSASRRAKTTIMNVGLA